MEREFCDGSFVTALWSESPVKHKAEQQMAYLRPRHETVVDMVCNSNVDVNAYLLIVYNADIAPQEKKTIWNFFIQYNMNWIKYYKLIYCWRQKSLCGKEGLYPY